MLILQRTNALFRPPSKWKFHPPTNGEDISSNEIKIHYQHQGS